MEADIQPGTVALRVSRRNLRALLAKLDGHPPGSACSISRYFLDDQGGYTELTLTAEEDEVHYADRPAGIMASETEAVLREPA